MTVEIKISKKDVVACNYWKACDYYKQLKRLEQKYHEVLKLAKLNADSNEYCLKKLEKENKILKNSLKDFQYSDEQHLLKVIELEKENKELEEKLNAFVEHSKTESDKVYYKMLDYETALEEIRTYLNTLSSIHSDFTSTETYLKITDKINEVLK